MHGGRSGRGSIVFHIYSMRGSRPLRGRGTERLPRLKSLQEGATSLWPSDYSVYASRLLFTHPAGLKPRHERSASRARLDTGGWLILTRPGLSPGKKRQASLDALTIKLTGGNEAERNCRPVQRLVRRFFPLALDKGCPVRQSNFTCSQLVNCR